MNRKSILKNFILFSSVFLFLFIFFNTVMAWALDAPGYIIYEKKGKVLMVQPDGAGEKAITDKGMTAGALVDPQGKNVFYVYNNKIFKYNVDDKKTSVVYQGDEKERLDLFAWKEDTQGLIFRKKLDKDLHSYFRLKEEGKPEALLTLYHNPFLSPTGKYWVYSDFIPHVNEKNCEIRSGDISSQEQKFVFPGKSDKILGWDKETPTVMYAEGEKIYIYDVVNRHRQILTLPFKDISVAALCYPQIIYYHNEQEDEDAGIFLYDAESGEQKRLVESKKYAYLVSMNPEQTKALLFCPQSPKNPLGVGELYLIETKNAEFTKLTQETGKRVFMEKNFDLQWSPDGKYIVYEKIKLKFDDIKSSEIWIHGEGTKRKINSSAFHPTWMKINR